MNEILKKIKNIYKKYFNKHKHKADSLLSFKQIEKNLIVTFDEILDILLCKSHMSNTENYLNYLFNDLEKNSKNLQNICENYPEIEEQFKNIFYQPLNLDNIKEQFNSIIKLDLPYFDDKRKEWHEIFLKHVKNKTPMWKGFLLTPCFKKIDKNDFRVTPIDGYYIYPPDDFVKEYIINEYKITLLNFFQQFLNFYRHKTTTSNENSIINFYKESLDEKRNFFVERYNIDLYEIRLIDFYKSSL